MSPALAVGFFTTKPPGKPCAGLKKKLPCAGRIYSIEFITKFIATSGTKRREILPAPLNTYGFLTASVSTELMLCDFRT